MTLKRSAIAAALIALSVSSQRLFAEPPVYPTVPAKPAPKAPAAPAPAQKAPEAKSDTESKPILAPEPELALKVGDKAPALTVGQWIQGEPIQSFEKDKIYVIEFWASWCGPCMAAIPHVNGIQEKFKDKGVTVIGVNCWEEDPEDADKALRKTPNKPRYRICRDDKKDDEKGKMAENWLAGAGRTGIPTTMLIDQNGMLAWIGHPLKMDGPLQSIVDKKWDLKKASAEFIALVKKEKALEVASGKFAEAVKAKNINEIFTVIDELAKLDPESYSKPLLMKYGVLLELGEFEKAYGLGDKIVDTHKNDFEELNQIAWSILDENSAIPERDFDFALKLAEQANKASKGTRVDILDTLAHGYLMTGNVDKAIEIGKQALAKADPKNKELVHEMTANLQMYEEEKKNPQKEEK